MKPDVVVVGAGIVGASCAYALSIRGVNVTVLEGLPHPAGGSTARSAAGVRHAFSLPENVKMSLYSTQVFADFRGLTGVDAGYHKVGYLFLLPPERWAGWQEQNKMQRTLGARVEALSPEALRERFPYLEPSGIGGATFGPDDGVVDPHAVTLGFLKIAREQGTVLRLDTEVKALSHQRGRWRLETSTGSLSADVVVNAAGAWAKELAARAGFALPVLPYRRNVYVTTPLSNFPHPTPLTIDMATGVWLRSEGERFIFGLSNPDEPAGDQVAVDWGWLEHTLERALPRFPFLEDAGLDVRACWAGLYAITPDHLPLLGRMVGVPGWINACGFSGHGVQHAPATGLITAEEVLEESHTFDLRPFRAERFVDEPIAGIETNVV